MKTINYNAIQNEIHKNYSDLKDGSLYIFDFVDSISEKYFIPIENEWDDMLDAADENPYLDVIYGMLRINGIEW